MMVLFFKQRTADEMRISDWSSDVCSSDLLMLDTLVAAVTHGRADHGTVIAAVRETLADATLDAAFIGEAVLLPSENFIGDQLAVVEPEAIFRARATLRRDLGTALDPHWRAARSEEHTSELQSLMRISYPVFFLKKK